MGIIYFCSVRQSGMYPFFRFSSFLKPAFPFLLRKLTIPDTKLSSILSNNTIIMYNSPISAKLLDKVMVCDRMFLQVIANSKKESE